MIVAVGADATEIQSALRVTADSQPRREIILEALRTRYVRNAGALDAAAVREARRLLDSMARECGIGV